MAPIAPQDVRPKVSIFWEAENTGLFRRLWDQAIRGPAKYAQVITWNDYGETTEIEPSSGTQFLFYDLSAYYIHWFKYGRPASITSDAIYYSQHTEIYKDGETSRPEDVPFRRMGRAPVSNMVEITAMLTAPATLEIETGGAIARRVAPAGLTVFSTPARIGRPIFRIKRGGDIVVEKRSDWTISDHPSAANPAYFGGSSNRRFVVVPGQETR